MAQKAPGRHYRKRLSLIKLTEMFPDDETAEKWFVEQRWPDGIACVHCGSLNVAHVKSRKPQPYRCRDCRRHFSVRSKTLMQSSNLGFQVWAMAFYLMATGIKGTSSMKLHRDLDITQKTAWHLAHRIRETWRDQQDGPFEGPVEVDETYIGGKERNKHASKKLHAGPKAGKTAVVGMKDRDSGKVVAEAVNRTDADTLQGFVDDYTEPTATVYTDDARAYRGMDRKHESVKHSVGEYVFEQAHTNGVESFWAMLKRGYVGTYHQMSPKHLDRYVDEFEGRHNQREEDTLQQMEAMARSFGGKQLRYKDLIASE